MADAKLISPTLFVVTNGHQDYVLTAGFGGVQMTDDDKNGVRRRNLVLGAVLAVAALCMYFGIFVCRRAIYGWLMPISTMVM